MKKTLFLLMAAVAVVLTACGPTAPVTGNVKVQITLDGAPLLVEGVTVTLASSAASYEAVTAADGSADFTATLGTYTATTSFKKSDAGLLYNYNGTASVSIVEGENPAVDLPVVASKSSQLILKEVYNGGCMDNDNNKNYQKDKYLIVYNNSDTEVDASEMCVAMAQIANTASTNKYPFTDGVIEYEAAGWTPASFSIWWFQEGTTVKIAPYSQIVIAISDAIDHTQTYTNSVDLSQADYCTYDLESGFTGYTAPAAAIPTENYMKTKVFGQGTAWPAPILTFAPFLIMPESDIRAFVENTENFDNRSTNNSGNFCKIPTGWVLDALDIWSAADESKFFLRFPSTVNTGYKVLTNKLGYSMYRNVDKEATEALPENEGKLVYNYDGAVSDEDTDPSGIDAEASIAVGAHIIYKDTNNSANDFHMRKVASIKK